MDRVAEFLAGYVVPAGAGLAGDPGLKASRDSTGGVLSVFETTINAAATDDERHRIGERHGIRVVRDEPSEW
jgi:hypothetical protein